MGGTPVEGPLMSGRTDPMNPTGEDIRDIFKAVYKRQALMPLQPWWKQGLDGIVGIARTAFVVNYGGLLLRVTMAPRTIARRTVAWPAIVHGFLAWHANLHGYILPLLWLHHHFLQ